MTIQEKAAQIRSTFVEKIRTDGTMKIVNCTICGCPMYLHDAIHGAYCRECWSEMEGMENE